VNFLIEDILIEKKEEGIKEKEAPFKK